MQESRKAGLSRLTRLAEIGRAVDIDMASERQRFRALEQREPVRAISSFNLFQTPQHIAGRMSKMVSGCRGPILEPSAGLGRIYHALRSDNPSARIELVEQSPDCCGELYALTTTDQNVKLHQRDFLEFVPASKFAAVVMNPPFKQGRDIKHILHAYGMLQPGGTLVALCFNGSQQNAKLRPWADSWEVLPEDTFKAEGTRASVVLLTKTHASQSAQKEQQ